MTDKLRPPLLARVLLAICIRGEAREVIAGDLNEEFMERQVSGASRSAAKRWYWGETLASIVAVRRRRPVTPPGAEGKRGRRQWRDGLLLDLRYTVRALRRSPGYAAVAVLSLAIGIGANTAIYSIVQAMLLDQLRVDRPDQLSIAFFSLPANRDKRVPMMELNSGGAIDPETGKGLESNYTYPLYEAMRNAAGNSADVFAFNFISQVDLSVDGQPAIAASAAIVSDNYYRALRPAFVAGRPLDESDDLPSAPAAAVLSYAFWTRAFGADPAVVNRTVRINGTPVVVVGVSQRGFRGLSSGGFFPSTEITLPLRTQPLVAPRWAPPGQSLFAAHDRWWLRVMARLRPGTNAGDLQHSWSSTIRAYFDEIGLVKSAASDGAKVVLLPGARGFDEVGRQVGQPLRLLAGVVAVVLLMTCVNVASLLLARGIARQRELAVRRALGASRARLIRQLLTESALLAVAGGTAGLLVARLVGPAVAAMLTAGLGPVTLDLGIDWRLFAVTAGVSGGAAILCGLIPALRLTRGSATDDLRQQSGATPSSVTMGRVLLAVQLAIAMPLVTGALLFLVTLHNLGQLNPGFSPANLEVFRVDPALAGGDVPGRNTELYRQLLTRLEAIPGVTSVTLMSDALMTGVHSSTYVTIAGKRPKLLMNAVGPRFFETMQIPIMTGRAPGLQDSATSPLVIVINQAAARQYFPNRSPLGEVVIVGNTSRQVVGVAADARYENLRKDIAPTIFVPFLQGAGVFGRTPDPGPMFAALRTAVAPTKLEAAIRQVVSEVDPDLPVTNFTTETAQIAETMGQERAFTRLLTAFGAFALLLACIGLHGATAYSVTRRTTEFGVRVALGARRSQILWLVLRQVLVLATVGIAIGVGGAMEAGPLAGSLLYGLAPRDPATLVAAALLMIAVTLVAGLLPARKASRMEALTALRTE